MGTAVPRWVWGEDLRAVREVVARGGVLGVPTGSSYALACDPLSEKGVAAIFRIKGRPANKPLPVVVPDLSALERLGVEEPEGSLQGLERAWPGPLSVLLPCSTSLPASAGRDRLAVRIPGHEKLRGLLERLGLGLTATSANRSDAPSLLDADEVAGLLIGEDSLLVDDGRLSGGEPSTLVEIRDGVAIVIRQGRITRAELERLAPRLFSAGAVEISVDESE